MDSKVFTMDSVVGERSLFLGFPSLLLSVNCERSSFFFYMNFLCLFSSSIFFMPLSDFYGESLSGEVRSGLLFF
jgi:hypothetical protein